MNELSFEVEWIDPEGARGPELRATWARLTLLAGGKPVTRVFDERTRSVRSSLYLPVYPLAEWIATNWWRLLHEVPSRGAAENGYRSRHCLSTAGEGFALPELCFEPLGETLRLSWTRRRSTRTPVEFLGEDSVIVGRDRARAALESFVDTVVGRLEDEGVEHTFLREEWQAIRHLTPDEERFCRLAGTLGWDPFQLTEAQADDLTAAVAKVPDSAQEEFLAAVDASSMMEEARAVAQALRDAKRSDDRLAPLRNLRLSFEVPELADEPPWRQGYEAARALRTRLGLDGAPLPSFEVLGRSLGLDGPSLEREIGRASGLKAVDGVVAMDSEMRPGFMLRATTTAARRFAFCRELFEYLKASEPRPVLVTRGVTHQQQRNRGFAAEFLLPSESLRGRFARPTASSDEANEIAEEFGVSWAVVAHQLDNHRIAQISAD